MSGDPMTTSTDPAVVLRTVAVLETAGFQRIDNGEEIHPGQYKVHQSPDGSFVEWKEKRTSWADWQRRAAEGRE